MTTNGTLNAAISVLATPTEYRHVDIAPAARELAGLVDVELVAEGVTDDIMADVWPHIDDVSFRIAVHRSVLDNLQAIFGIVAGRRELDSAELPQGALDFAEVCAQLDVPVTDVERAYRIGIAALWTRWFDIARAHAEGCGSPLDELMSGPTLTILGYTDHIMGTVISRHDAIRHELHRTRRDLRRLTLTQILDGSIDEVTDDLNRALDYCLTDTHLALMLQTTASRAPEREIAALRAAADARGTLVHQHGPHSWIVWLGFRSGFGPAQRSRLRRALTDSGFIVAVGEPAAGLPGLRRSRQQALEAAHVQRALGSAGDHCLWAREVRLEALLLNDERRAREFVADELGRLAARDSQAERLRETLLAWLATGSHVSAAAILGVHENTVRNRIRTAEDLLGTPLTPRRTELQVALRLSSVLDRIAAVPA
jgi:PucR-like helix-turn-helix protein/diguanylate cyclase with GGDEF domain